MHNKPHTSEAKAKMREAKLRNPVRYWQGKVFSDEHRKKLSEARKGKSPWNKGLKGVMPDPWNKGKPGYSRKSYPIWQDKPHPRGMLGKTPWNKGLKGCFTHSEKTKQKMRNARLRYLSTPEGLAQFMSIRKMSCCKPSRSEEILVTYLSDYFDDFIPQYRVGRYTLDIAFPKQMIDVEVDGYWHSTQKVHERDKRRDMFLRSSGWSVLRFPAREVNRDVDAVVDSIASQLR